MVNGSFSISLAELNYNAGFTAQIVSYTAQATESCYTVAMGNNNTVATFTPRSAPAIGSSSSSPSPCSLPSNDIEAALFEDQQGNGTQVYFENATAAPNASIQVHIAGTTPALSTAASSPLLVSNAFVLSVSETNYTGPFTASVASYTAATTQSCYTVSMDTTGTIATLVPRAAAALGGSSVASPCIPPSSDVEAVLFEDQRGQSAEVFFQNQGTTAAGAIQTTLVSTSQPLGISLSKPLQVANSFAVMLSESGYPGPFTASIASFTAPTSQSCYTISLDVTGTIATLTPRSASSLSGATPSPCSVANSDIEGVLFGDGRGNLDEQFFQNQL